MPIPKKTAARYGHEGDWTWRNWLRPARRLTGRIATLVFVISLLSACEGHSLIGPQLSGDWCMTSETRSPTLSLSGNGTGMMVHGIGIPIDWKEDRGRLVLMKAGSAEVIYTIPIVTDGQGRTQLMMLPGLGDFFNLHRCASSTSAPEAPHTTTSPPNATLPTADYTSRNALALMTGGAVVVLLLGAVVCVILMQQTEGDED